MCVHALSDQDRLLLMPAWDARIVLLKLVGDGLGQ
jgi:hypothetical protein